MLRYQSAMKTVFASVFLTLLATSGTMAAGRHCLLRVDQRVSDGQIYIPSGLTTRDIDLMKEDWHAIGQRKR
jgi:hypothetical protein